ncbi:MAG: hypothetical protein HZA46_01940, partial [Planctomycetales bacterium]|nr:hypothetical protein [Planctomycetales bacterium]
MADPNATTPPETGPRDDYEAGREWLRTVYQGDRVRQLSVRSVVTGMLIGGWLFGSWIIGLIFGVFVLFLSFARGGR